MSEAMASYALQTAYPPTDNCLEQRHQSLETTSVPTTPSPTQPQTPLPNHWPQQPLDFSTKRSLCEEPMDSVKKEENPLVPLARKANSFEESHRGKVDVLRDPQGDNSASSFQEGALNLTRSALPFTCSRSSASSSTSVSSSTLQDQPPSLEERATPCCSPQHYPRTLHFGSSLPLAFHVLQARPENIPSPPPMRLSHLTHGQPQQLSKTEAAAHLLSQLHAHPLFLSTLSSVLVQQQQQQQKNNCHLQPHLDFWRQHGERGPLTTPEHPGIRAPKNLCPSPSSLLIPSEVLALSSSPTQHAFCSFPPNGAGGLVAPSGRSGETGHRLGVGAVAEEASKSALGRGGLCGVGLDRMLGVSGVAGAGRLTGELAPASREEQVITAESNKAYSKFREQMMTQMQSAKLRRYPSAPSESHSSNSASSNSDNSSSNVNKGGQVTFTFSTDDEQENTAESTGAVAPCDSEFEVEVHDAMMDDDSGGISSTVGGGVKRCISPAGTEYNGRKDEAYWERRRKNNEAAKRSRDARRAKEDEIAIRAAFLEQENIKLRVEVASLRSETGKLRCLLCNS